MRAVVAAFLLSNAAAAAALEVSLALDSISHQSFSAERVNVQAQGDVTLLTIARLRLGGRELRDLRLRCGEFEWNGNDLHCRGGTLKVGAGETAALDVSYRKSRGELELTLRDSSVAGLTALLPQLAVWNGKGRLSGTVRLSSTQAGGDLTLTGGTFANAAGTQAGEGLTVRLAGRAQESGGAWRWTVAADLRGGEVYWQPWYVKTDGQKLEARGVLDEASLRVDAAHLMIPGIGTLEANANWDRQLKEFKSLQLTSDVWQAGAAWARYGQPMLGESPRVKPDGTLKFSLAYDKAGLQSVDLDVALDRIDVADGRYAFKDLQARVPWRRNALTQAHIASGGGRAGDLPFGAFTVPLNMEGLRFRFDQVAIPLLDGRLLFEDFALRQLDSGWNWRLAAALEPVSMPRLTKALGLPLMAGTMSANMPRMRYRDGTLSLSGSLIVSVFDGYLAVEDLRIVDAFGRSPRAQADVSARHLNLAQLTQTFSFGNITGFIDADLRGLEMAGWQPAAFDARVVTSDGDFPRRISRRAVRNISALGGGASAGVAVETSVVGFFDTFGYERLGLSCRLLAGVCHMGGLEEREHGYLIVQGGGLPSLNVMGYNRRVGWDVFVARLREVAAGNSKAIIE